LLFPSSCRSFSSNLPTYILDEIDAALDLSHTQHIGQLFRTRFNFNSSSFRLKKGFLRMPMCFSEPNSVTGVYCGELRNGPRHHFILMAMQMKVMTLMSGGREGQLRVKSSVVFRKYPFSLANASYFFHSGQPPRHICHPLSLTNTR
jgi:hypothetical protein